MVEFSIIAFLLLVMVFGMVDYGRYFLLRANLTNAVREGARFAATLPGSPPDQTTVENYTRARISFGNSALGVMSVTAQGASIPTNPSRVRVQLLNYPFTPATFLVIKSAKTISVTAEFRKEQP
jgi:Flp pilus assembly protein TadG